LDADDDAVRELSLRAKAVLRQRARALRNTMPAPALAARSGRIVTGVLSLGAVVRADSVALFWPILTRNEIDLRPLDAALRAQGKRVAYPAIDPDTDRMVFRWVAVPESMEERGLGFRDPGADAPEVDRLDVIVVPALQVDPRGYRLGYGRGYYDRTLPRYRPPAVAVCVAYDFQLVQDLPITDGDVAVDIVLTDERTIEVSV